MDVFVEKGMRLDKRRRSLQIYRFQCWKGVEKIILCSFQFLYRDVCIYRFGIYRGLVIFMKFKVIVVYRKWFEFVLIINQFRFILEYSSQFFVSLEMDYLYFLKFFFGKRLR